MTREEATNSAPLPYRLATIPIESTLVDSSCCEMTFFVTRGRYYYRMEITPESVSPAIAKGRND